MSREAELNKLIDMMVEVFVIRRKMNYLTPNVNVEDSLANFRYHEAIISPEYLRLQAEFNEKHPVSVTFKKQFDATDEEIDIIDKEIKIRMKQYDYLL